jgi:hypothetical protein
MTSTSEAPETIPIVTGALRPNMDEQNEPLAVLPSRAESTLNAIQALLERYENNKKSNHSQIPASQNGSFDSTMSVDVNLQLVSQLKSVVENYHRGKEQIPRSGIAEEGIELRQYDGTGSLLEMPLVC